MRKNKQGSQLYSEKRQVGCSSSNVLSENLESCSRLEAALDELNEADIQVGGDPSYPSVSDNSFVLDRVRVARLRCYEAAQTVLRSHPQTCFEKITMLDVITAYLMTVDLDQLERFKLRNSKLISSRKSNPYAPNVAVACSSFLTVEPGAKT